MDRLAVPPTEGALAATRAGLRKAIELAREARIKKARRA